MADTYMFKKPVNIGKYSIAPASAILFRTLDTNVVIGKVGHVSRVFIYNIFTLSFACMIHGLYYRLVTLLHMHAYGGL